MNHSLSALLLVFLIVAAKSNSFPHGNEYSYQFSNDVFIKDFQNGRPVAYRLLGTLKVTNILSANEKKLLKFKLEKPELHVRPHRSNSQTEFHFHRSPLDNYANEDFYALWNDGNVSDIYYNAHENIALVNVKKSIVNLFQYKRTDDDFVEQRTAGKCSVRYRETSNNGLRRMKQNCEMITERIVRPEKPLQMKIQSYRSADYEFLSDESIKFIESRDYFHIALELNRNIGGSIDSIITLRFDKITQKTNSIVDKTPKEFLTKLPNYKGEKLQANIQNVQSSKQLELNAAIKLNFEALKELKVGTIESAKAFLHILPTTQNATKSEFIQMLKSKKSNEIKLQMLDIFGAANTINAYEAVKEVIGWSDEHHIDEIERFIQSLAIAVRPNKMIILNLLKDLDDKSIDNKVAITMIHAIGSMARRFAQSPNHNYSSDVVVKVIDYFKESIGKCAHGTCFINYLNGMRNIQSIKLIETIFKYVNDSHRTVSLAAIKALKSYPSSIWTAEHIKQFEDIFYQRYKRYDSSVRTLALDIILNTKLSNEQIKMLLMYLKSNDRAYEVTTYLIEMLNMHASQNVEFKKIVVKLLQSDRTLNNYDILGKKGLSTALTRSYSMQSPFNGTLTSIQEIFGGVLKRGAVELTMDSETNQFNFFTLGLTSGGLTSFVSSELIEDDEFQDDTANAGMEMTVQDTYLRPLQLFNSQSELMGHVWSGTASEPTAAFHGTHLLHDHHEMLQMHNGATVHMHLNSATSIDLNGAIQLSIWNRNAQIQVNQFVGLYLEGEILVNAGFVMLNLNLNIEKDSKLHLKTDVDFSFENILCMQLSQPDEHFWYKMEKNQIIPEIRHHVKSFRRLRFKTFGHTHNLNDKNNAMCNKIFSI